MMNPALTKEEYLKDPCRASSLPFWKTERLTIPVNVSIFREDEFCEEKCTGKDEPYFKMIHRLKSLQCPVLPAGYRLTAAGAGELADHIRECYTKGRITAGELETYIHREVFDRDLWIAIREDKTGRIAASGIGEWDPRIGEGILEWIQVSPDHRRRGLGRIIVYELLRRLSGKAAFVTVSGSGNNPDRPFALYRACGFEDPVIWHIVRK